MTRKVVGIDLGTTFSAIAHLDSYGKAEIVPNAETERITPSVILFEGSEVIVGTTAKQSAVAEPEKIVDFVKREMGRNVEQFHRSFNGHSYTAEQLSSLIIRKLKKDAEKYTGETVTDAVITVPAYFNDAERTATVQAGKLAGLNVLRVINEPTAAAIAYGLHKNARDEIVAVFDLGGGTFDVTLMRVEANEIRMLASHGDHRLGGKDWDDTILHWAAAEFETTHGLNPLLDLQSYQELYNRALAAKIQLTTRPRTTLVHSYNGKSIKLEITREQFETRCRNLLERCKAIAEIALQDAGLLPAQVDRVVLAGGMTRLPSVRRMVEALFEAPIAEDVNPDECVAVGAAIAGVLALCEEEQETGRRIVPPEIARRFTREDCGLVKVTDITTHTLGVVLWDHEKKEEFVFPMIPRRTPIPVARRDSFGASKKLMTSATVRVMEGESLLPGECNLLGTCTIDFPDAVTKGAPVELTYCYTRDQVLEVTIEAFDRVNRLQITRGGNLDDAGLAEAAAELAKIQVF